MFLKNLISTIYTVKKAPTVLKSLDTEAPSAPILMRPLETIEPFPPLSRDEICNDLSHFAVQPTPEILHPLIPKEVKVSR